jgi:hypothetical protein
MAALKIPLSAFFVVSSSTARSSHGLTDVSPRGCAARWIAGMMTEAAMLALWMDNKLREDEISGD